jgi:hypothetical protein
MTKLERASQVCFDEMYTKKRVAWSAKHDLIIGPGKKLQVLVVRGLASPHKFPVFYDFDRKMTPRLLREIIFCLEQVCHLHILTSVCDQAGMNIEVNFKRMFIHFFAVMYIVIFSWNWPKLPQL